ncbi:hypothetical protein [Pseudoflavonifractor sp. 524-17]|uniref:hypothetical protein n=1 Tax=Pseudoflavonifractor sp. 524-17 TaxID=2304577 RepID=UPI00137B1259|nr:hypothetical protein [Pseudoflavonifractor sp. 524-17]
MATISTFLQKILDAVYGEEVRGSIHDALAAMNVESSSAMEFAATAKDSAKASADAAGASASTAAQRADEAVASAGAAQVSETEAKKAENAALAAKADAELARKDAEGAKSAAQTAKSDAESSADAAAASALSARQYSGKPPKPQDGTWWVWDAEQEKYINSGIGCELVGPAGNGIHKIQLTKGDHTPGTTDIYTLTMTDGTVYSIPIHNGRNGTGAGDVLGTAFNLVLPAAGWVNGELTVADSRLLALAAYKYFLSADEASSEEYLVCNVRPKDISTTGFITFKNNADPTEDLTVNVIRLELSANGEEV